MIDEISSREGSMPESSKWSGYADRRLEEWGCLALTEHEGGFGTLSRREPRESEWLSVSQGRVRVSSCFNEELEVLGETGDA